MSERVWKYVVPHPDVRGRVFIDMPAVVKPLSVGMQGDEIVLWALVRPGADVAFGDDGPRRFVVWNTGDPIPDFPEGAVFLGTVTSSNGVVWHVWDGDAGANHA